MGQRRDLRRGRPMICGLQNCFWDTFPLMWKILLDNYVDSVRHLSESLIAASGSWNKQGVTGKEG